MSGITGVMNLDRRTVWETEVLSMHELLSHRGPDGGGTWHSEHIGLAHQKLATTPESHYEWMPLASERGSRMIVADARIDNRKELISKLALTPKKGEPITDAEIILAAYDEWGVRCSRNLVGAYAFVIWDEEKQHLLCARDHFGLKPLYYAHIEGNRFAFASEIKSILSLKDIPKEINDTAVADHLLVPVESDAVFTFYKHILRLEPGHYLVVKTDTMRKEKYWEFDPNREIKYASDAEYAEALKEIFLESVRCRTRSSHAVGAMLSGGLDSSSIVGAAAQQLGTRNKSLHTFSAVFEEVKKSDEWPYIDSVVNMYQDRLVPHIVSADSVSPFYAYNKVLWHQDSAMQAGNMYFFWKLYEKAQAENVRVIMDGFDGDTTLSHGVGYLHELANKKHWYTLYREVRLIHELWGKPWKRQMWKWVKLYGIAPMMDRFPLLQSTIRSGKKAMHRDKQSMPVDADSLKWQHVLNEQFAQGLKPQLRTPIGYPKTEREYHHLLLKQPVMQRIIETWEASAAAFGIELRLPFCDRRLIEFCLALPPRQKRREGWTRVAMRNAMEGVLPEKVRLRPDKGNLAPGFEHGLLVRDPVHLNEMIAKDTGGIGRYVNLKSLSESLPTFTAGKESNNTTFHWRALSLALWLNYTGL
ncbi:MAG: lasso peptide isopeptide bond-forming cyclase [Rhodothermaceae bacterium]|nr:lasso peptide isopeptide bond-forming cyclase [Rhodothermaceae bacterium]